MYWISEKESFSPPRASLGVSFQLLGALCSPTVPLGPELQQPPLELFTKRNRLTRTYLLWPDFLYLSPPAANTHQAVMFTFFFDVHFLIQSVWGRASIFVFSNTNSAYLSDVLCNGTKSSAPCTSMGRVKILATNE